MADWMRLRAETRAERSRSHGALESLVSRPPLGWFVPAAALAVLVLLLLDVGRALDTGIADAGLAYFVAAACVGVAAALAVGRWPDRRWMAGLVLLWLFVGAVDDLDWD